METYIAMIYSFIVGWLLSENIQLRAENKYLKKEMREVL